MVLSFSFKKEKARPGQEVQFSIESSLPLSWRMEVGNWAWGGITSHAEWEPRAEAEVPAV